MKPLVQPETPRAARIPWWVLLALGMVTAIAWWPQAPYWQSDDYLALAYSADAGRAWSDWTGNQYGLTGVVWFYRPLVTLSFWFEQVLWGGPSPVASHLFNLALHIVSVGLVAGLGARLGSVRAGVLAAVVWAMVPAHSGVVSWTVGRVDGLATLFMLLCAHAFLRQIDGRTRRRWPWVLAFVAALVSKESALALPGALVVLAAATGTRDRRIARALAAWPCLAVLAAYFLVRWLALGRGLGGYDDGTIQPLSSLTGFGTGLLQILAPDDLATRGGLGAIAWLRFVPLAALTAALVVRQRALEPLLALAAALALAIPALPLWSQLGQPMNERLLHASLVPIALACGRSGLLPSLAFLLLFTPTHLLRSAEHRVAWHSARAMHELLRHEGDLLDAPRLFVAGLPRSDASGRNVLFHLGVDRLLAPPFTVGPARRVLAMRPLAQRADAIRCPYDAAFGLPFDEPTLRFEGESVAEVLPRSKLADLELRYDGPTTVPSDAFLDLDARRLRARVTVLKNDAPWLRVTLFTPGGYLATLLPSRSPDDAAESAGFDLARFLRARFVTTVAADNAHVLFALGVATTFDLETRYPVLVEAGDIESSAAGPTFRATAANRVPLELGFDRGIAAFLAGGR